MPLVDLIDETFIVADPAELAARIHDPELWHRWWPGCELVVFMDRAEKGIRWTITGSLVGTCELWLEAFGDGVIVHYYLRADPTRPGSSTEALAGPPEKLQRVALRELREQARWFKRCVNELKDELERGRPVGEPRVPVQQVKPAALAAED